VKRVQLQKVIRRPRLHFIRGKTVVEIVSNRCQKTPVFIGGKTADQEALIIF
jgi:hypothetical protein